MSAQIYLGLGDPLGQGRTLQVLTSQQIEGPFGGGVEEEVSAVARKGCSHPCRTQVQSVHKCTQMVELREQTVICTRCLGHVQQHNLYI